MIASIEGRFLLSPSEFAELTTKYTALSDENAGLVAENARVKAENAILCAENQALKTQVAGLLAPHVQARPIKPSRWK